MSTKNTYRIHERLVTWATCDIEADSLQEALDIAGTYDDDIEWTYETDYDSGVITHGDILRHGTREDLLGVNFVDPYLGRDDVVWEVNADAGGGAWQAEIVSADPEHDDDLGTCDLYPAEFIQMYRIER